MALRIIRKKKKRKPGHRAGLTRRIIALAAADQVEESRSSTLSLRRLARSLGVSPTSIISHFKSGATELEDEIIRAVLADVAPPFEPNQEPEAYIVGLFCSVLEALKGRPVIAMMAIRRLTSNPFVALMLAERSLASLVALGVTPEHLAVAYRSMLQALFAMILSGPVRSFRTHQSEGASPPLMLPASEYPHALKFQGAILKDVAAAASWEPVPKLVKEGVQDLVERLCV